MTERRGNFKFTKTVAVLATPFIIGGTASYIHGNNVENHGANNRQIQREAISKQVDELFPQYDQNAVDNSTQFITHIQHELASLISEGNLSQANRTIADNTEGLKQLGTISENETIKNNVKQEIINQKDLNELGKGSWYTLGGFFVAAMGVLTIASGAFSDTRIWLVRRTFGKSTNTSKTPKQA